ncbi:hypothetical protein V499_07947 [Pseudogymnoascus sp. VKM F-103]|jgi:hypothetical protein|nr:hypothetical protein V499_07947 [Pseudogymnoascus sp. VKM F-103]
MASANEEPLFSRNLTSIGRECPMAARKLGTMFSDLNVSSEVDRSRSDSPSPPPGPPPSPALRPRAGLTGSKPDSNKSIQAIPYANKQSSADLMGGT